MIMVGVPLRSLPLASYTTPASLTCLPIQFRDWAFPTIGRPLCLPFDPLFSLSVHPPCSSLVVSFPRLPSPECLPFMPHKCMLLVTSTFVPPSLACYFAASTCLINDNFDRISLSHQPCSHALVPSSFFTSIPFQHDILCFLSPIQRSHCLLHFSYPIPCLSNPLNTVTSQIYLPCAFHCAFAVVLRWRIHVIHVSDASPASIPCAYADHLHWRTPTTIYDQSSNTGPVKHISAPTQTSCVGAPF